MKAEMECMQRELDKQRQANSEGATCGQERCTPKPSSKDMPGSRRVAHSQAGNGMCRCSVLACNLPLVCVGGRGVSRYATVLAGRLEGDCNRDKSICRSI